MNKRKRERATKEKRVKASFDETKLNFHAHEEKK
jgi:hypothetical protein